MAELILQYLIFFFIAGSNFSDSEKKNLAQSIKNGDHKAFKAFFNAYHNALFRFLMSKGIAKEAAEDLIQKAFIYIWEHRRQIDPSKSLRAYLFRIGYTRMLNHIRDHAKFDTSEELAAIKSHQNQEDNIQAKELRKAIDKAIEAMPEKRGLIFEMCFIQEFTYKETAQALDLSPKTVENHMGLALKDIRTALKEFEAEDQY